MYYIYYCVCVGGIIIIQMGHVYMLITSILCPFEVLC